MKKNLIKVLLLVLLSFLIIGNLSAKPTEKSNNKKEENVRGFISNVNELKELSDIMDVIMDNFVGEKEIDRKELLHGAIKGMMDSLGDPHSVYFEAKEMKEFSEDMKGEYAGVGMVVSKKDNILTVVSPIEDTPAYKAGMKPNDKIIKIEEESTLELTVDQCVERLKGKPNTKVKITVIRESKEKAFDVVLTRALIKLKYVKYKMLDDKIGYVKLTQFSENVAVDVRKAVEDLVSQGMTSLVFDLRYNPGGSLGEAIKVSSIFVDQSPIVTVKDKKGEVEEYKRIGKAYTEFPLVVLINGGSASASEIVSGAIKDYKRGILVGEKSYGKGSVQNLVPLQDGDALKLTIAKYYTPSGECIHQKGIMPDVYVKEPENFIPFDGFITNVAEDKKENTTNKAIDSNTKEKDTNLTTTGQAIGQKNQGEDEQLKMALGLLKGIMIYQKK